MKYLEEVPTEKSLWQGECFVFDQRVSLKHGLEIGDYEQCYACRRPITKEGMRSPLYKKGISCLYCFDETNEEQKQRFAMRQQQLDQKTRLKIR